MNKQDKLCCNIILKNNDVCLRLYYNTHEIKLKDIIIYILEYKNNEYIIDSLSTASNKIFKSILKKFGLTQLEIEIIETIHRYDVVDYNDLILKLKDNPDEIPKLSINEYLKLNDPLQKNIYALKPKQDALQHKLNFIAHLLKAYKYTIIKANAVKITNIHSKAYDNIIRTTKYNNISDIDNIIKLLKG